MRTPGTARTADGSGGSEHLAADRAAATRIRRVHVVFKTHLDLEFTDFAEAVNLWNNMWNANFCCWSEADARYRFRLALGR